MNNGDEVTAEYRSRLVAKEIKVDKRLDLFAARPPLEAKKMLFSLAVPEGIGFKGMSKKKGMNIDFIDTRKAYFQAAAIRDLYVELLEENMEDGLCGKLLNICVEQGMPHTTGK